jgi:DNA-binding NarL/FixJ family response regulator
MHLAARVIGERGSPVIFVVPPVLDRFSVPESRSAAMVYPSEKPELIRVLLADRTRMSGQLLADVLRRDKHLDVTDATDDSIETLTTSIRPHVAILSGHTEGNLHGGFDLLRTCHTVHPKMRVVILLDRSEPDLVVKAFREGARGVFCRCDSLNELPKCVRAVHANQIWINLSQLEFVMQALAEAPATNPIGIQGEVLLSKRESEVVRWLAEGLGNREIAKELHISEHTVKNYLFRIFNKLGVSSRVEVVLYATSQRVLSVKRSPKSA